MPLISGKELAQKIKTLPDSEHVALVLMIPLNQLISKKDLANLGIYNYLTKPIKPDSLRNLLYNFYHHQNIGESFSNFSTAKSESSTKTIDFTSSPQRILLVEDNKVNVIVAKKLLQKMGLEVDVAYNGIEAIAKLKSSFPDHTYDLILMDCLMLEMDGYEATRAIRAGEAGTHYQNITIIAMTANAMKGDQEKCLATGMNDYISKPIEPKILTDVLTKWLKIN
jgi:CheY-like chemotaxis protein